MKNLRTPHIRFLLFDAVGTLIHVRPSVAEVYHGVAQRFGSRMTVDEIQGRFAEALGRHHGPGPTDEPRERERWEAIVKEVLHDIPHAGSGPFEELWQRFARSDHWALFSDVSSAWKGLQARGLVLGIASNFDSRLTGICQALPPLQSAAHCFYSSDLGFTKPHVEFFRAVERRLDAVPQEILLVGDSVELDLEGARIAGWHSIHLDRKCSPLPAAGTITSLTDLLELL